MKNYDFRFSNELFQSFVGKQFNKYKHYRFIVTNSVSQCVGIMIDGISYEMRNDYEPLDYFGWDSEATVSSFAGRDWNEILSAYPEDIVSEEVNAIIESIIIVNDHFSSFCHGECNYDYWETRSVIFKFKNHELHFAKEDCWFSMVILIDTGTNLIDKVPDGKEILEDFEQSDEQRIEVNREIIVFK